MKDLDAPPVTIEDWIVELDLSEAEARNGDLVPLADALAQLYASAARVAAKRAAKAKSNAAP